MDLYHCPICKAEVNYYPRYPKYVCIACAEKAADKDGQLLSFYNTSLSGGFEVEYRASGEAYNSNTCYIDGIECFADEARFGGIVIQVAE